MNAPTSSILPGVNKLNPKCAVKYHCCFTTYKVNLQCKRESSLHCKSPPFCLHCKSCSATPLLKMFIALQNAINILLEIGHLQYVLRYHRYLRNGDFFLHSNYAQLVSSINVDNLNIFIVSVSNRVLQAMTLNTSQAYVHADAMFLI